MIHIIRHKIVRNFALLSMALCIIGFSAGSVAHAQPYGKGTFGADVPYGSQTSLSIATGGNVSIQITPDDNAVLGTGTNLVTVTSTDVVGYSLYIRSLTSSNMTNGPAVLPASGNAVPGALSANTWGYNSNLSPTNFVGMTTANVLVKSGTGPFTAGDPTTFTYGVKIDNEKPAGNYVTSVVYTAAPQTD
ncbi:MAG: hypothetical protein WCO19_00720 [Candidatus Saccharibacteria bacterium]